VKFKISACSDGNAAIINLNSFEGAMTVFIDPGASPGPVSSGGTLSFSFDALEAAGVNTWSFNRRSSRRSQKSQARSALLAY
jgi:hypothetical protein